jgi:hypothetical protein
MSLLHTDSIDTVLTCTYEEFQVFYDNSNLHTEVLVRDALSAIIPLNKKKLHKAESWLTNNIASMTSYLPCSCTCQAPWGNNTSQSVFTLHIKRAKTGVVNAAKAWLDNIFLLSSSLFLLLISSNS